MLRLTCLCGNKHVKRQLLDKKNWKESETNVSVLIIFQHHLEKCEYNVKACPNISIGCTYVDAEFKLKQHIPNCEYRCVNCPHCSDLIPDKFLEVCALLQTFLTLLVWSSSSASSSFLPLLYLHRIHYHHHHFLLPFILFLFYVCGNIIKMIYIIISKIIIIFLFRCKLMFLGSQN